MAKQTTLTTGKGLRAAQRAAKAPTTPATVVQAQPAQAPNPATVLAQALAAAQPKPVQATPATALASMAATLAAVAQPPVQAPVVAVRGGLAIASVKLTGKPYRVGCTHNANWWQQCTQAVAQGNGQASVQALVQAGVPAIFVGYVVRRGYMAPAT